jgi:two-component system nitrogen regulation sensor histidine kinase NtrY
MITVTRFERKIALALLTVGFAPLLAALWIGRGAVSEAYGVGVNARVRSELEGALDLYTDHLKSLRAQAEQTVSLVATDPSLGLDIEAGDRVAAESRLERLLDAHPSVARAQVFLDGKPWLTVARADRLDRSDMRPLVLAEPIAPMSRNLVEVTTITAWAPFRAHERAAEIVSVYEALEQESDYLSATYLGVFIALLSLVIAVTVGVGIVLARRVTRRVTVLAEATRRVGAGDLSVSVPADSRDEVGELTVAFNTMVRDLRESQGRIEFLQRIGAWQEFARRLAHEIKNPLTPIQLAVQEMHRSYAGDDEKYRRKLDDATAIVEEEINTLRRLVGEFSSFAKLPKAELTRSDLAVFVRDIERSVGAILEDETVRGGAPANVRISFDLPSAAVPVQMDPMMLKRAVDNLVRNAVEACRGLPQASVILRVRATKKEAVLEIHDSGPGIPEADRERVFDPYFTTKTDGTGLGLPIVKKVVLEHGGSIDCAASEIGGACFRIRLPVS